MNEQKFLLKCSKRCQQLRFHLEEFSEHEAFKATSLEDMNAFVPAVKLLENLT